MATFENWQAREQPTKEKFVGRFVTLEKLNAAVHANGLYEASTQEDSEARFTWLYESKPQNRDEFRVWMEKAEASLDPLFYVVIDNRSGKIAGRQTLMRIDVANGVIETGNILWNKDIAKTPATTEAFYLFAKYVFEELGYRRFEWKCNNKNEPSKIAALRYGMKHEGVFRQHLIVKGENRNTAWFSMLDHEWPKLKIAFEAWLAPENFDSNDQQKSTLGEQRKLVGAV